MLKHVNLEKYNWKWKEGTIIYNKYSPDTQQYRIIGRKYSNGESVYILHKIYNKANSTNRRGEKYTFVAHILEATFIVKISDILKKL